MAQKSKIQIEIEYTQKGLENLGKGFTSAFEKVAKSLGVSENETSKFTDKLKGAEKVVEHLGERLEQVAKTTTKTANAFSQVFSKKEAGYFSSYANLFGNIKTSGLDTLLAASKEQYQQKLATFSLYKDLQARAKETDPKNTGLIAMLGGQVTSAGKAAGIETFNIEEYRGKVQGHVDFLKTKKVELEKELASLGKNVSKEMKGYKKQLETDLKETNKQLDGHKNAFSIMTSSVISSTKNLIKWQAQWYAAKAVLFAVTQLPISAGKTFVEWEQSLKNVGAVSEASSFNMKKLEEVSLEIGRTTPISAKQAGKAMLEFAQAGVDTNTILTAMPVAAKMVVATQEDMATAVSALTTVYNVWNKEAQDMNKVGGQLAAAMADSKLKVADLSTVFNYLASTSKLAGNSLEDTLVVTTALSKAGVKSSTIGTGLSTFMSAFVKMPTNLKKELEAKGIKIADVLMPENDVVTVLKRLKAANFDIVNLMKGMEIRGSRAAGAVLNQAIDALDNIREKINRPGILDKMFGTSMEGTQNQLKMLGNIMENVFIQLGRDSATSINELVKSLIELAKALEMAFSKVDGFEKKLYELSDSAKAIVLVFKIVKDTIISAFDVFVLGARVSIGGLITAFEILAKVIAGVAGALSMLKNRDFLGAMKVLGEMKDDILKTTSDWIAGLTEPGENINKRLGSRGLDWVKTYRAMFGGPQKLSDFEAGYQPGPYTGEEDKNNPDRPSSSKGRKASINRMSKYYNDLLAIEKSYASVRLFVNENMHKMGLISDEKWYKIKLKDISLNLDYELGVLEEKEKELFSFYEEQIGVANTSPKENRANAVAKVKEDYKKGLMEINKQRITLTNEANKNIGKTHLDFDLNEIKKKKDTLKLWKDIEDAYIKNDLELLTETQKQKETQNKWLFDSNKISATEFFSFSMKKIQEEAQAKKDALDLELKNLEKYNKKAIELGGLSETEIKKMKDEESSIFVKNELEKLKISSETSTAIADIVRQMSDNIKLAYDKGGFAGAMGKSLELLGNQYRDTAGNIQQATNNIVQSIESGMGSFFDYMSDKFMDFEAMALDVLHTIYMEFVKTILIKQWIGAMFGTATGGATGGGFLGTLFGSIFGRAEGGYVSVNKPYIVGERGPELFVPNSGGTIVPNGMNSGNMNVEINVENKTAMPLNLKMKGSSFKDNKYIVTAILENYNSYGELYHLLNGGNR